MDGQKRTIKEYSPDYVKIMSDGFFGHPSVWENEIENLEDLKKVKSVGADHEWIDAQVTYVKNILDSSPTDMYYFYNIFSPLQYIRLKFEEYDEDFKKFTRLFLEDPAVMVEAAKEIEQDIEILVDRLFNETELDGIYYSVQNVQSKEANHDFHKKYVEPSDLSLLNTINKNTDKVLLHICGYGNYKNDLTFYKEYPVSAVNWAVFTENISLGAGKKIFNKPVFGGFDNSEGSILYNGSEEDLRSYIYHMLDESGIAGVSIGADCTVSEELSSSRVKMIDKIAQEYLDNKKDE